MSEEKYPTTKDAKFWYTLPLICVITFLLIFAGQLLGDIIKNIVHLPDDPATTTFAMYAYFIGIWIVFFIVVLARKRNRFILERLGTKPAGNTIAWFLLFLIVGIGLNGLCFLAARLNKDVAVVFDRFEILPVLAILFAVLIQSGAEEIMCRGYFYEKIRETYKSPWVAIISNAVFFAMLHCLNPGVTLLSILNLILTGFLFSFIVYYFDSLWGAMALHTGWNYCQSIILGLPNSGIVVPYSIFKLDTASARNSFAYNVDFGIEGTIVACVVLAIACVVLYVLGRKRQQKIAV